MPPIPMVNVLFIEDRPSAAARIVELLCAADREEFAISFEATLEDGVRRLDRESFDVALVGLTVLGDTGAPGIAELQARAPLLPVVVLCRNDERKAAADTLRRGAQDYVADAECTAELLGRVLLWAVERGQTSSQLAFLTRHDALTGLANRAAFRDRIAQALARSERSHKPGALLLVDLDSFKKINDTRGQDIGDLLLEHTAGRLRALVRPYDVVARLGADEFGVLLEEVTEARDAGRLAERVLATIAEPFVIGSQEIHTTASLGAAIFPFDGAEPSALLANADYAMGRAKCRGGGSCVFYTPSTGVRIHEQLALEQDLQRALAGNEFVLHYQPQTNLRSGRVVGCEALLRWEHPERGRLAPDRFLSTVEKSGLVGALGEWVLRTACRQRRLWQADGLPIGRVAVNLSARHLAMRGFLGTTEKILHEEALDPRLLEFEVTEALFLDHDPATLEKITALRRLGIRISIDDFGTGHSCLGRLAQLPVDALKVDRSIVGQAANGRQSSAIARAVLALARELGLAVTCEGVENAGQLDFLRDHDCDAIQGHWVGAPLPAEELPHWLAAHHDTPTSDPGDDSAGLLH